jgi:hypothetical protein
MQSIMPRYQAIKQNLIETAELFPEGDYSYRLTPGQRTVAEWMDHNVSMLHGMCATIQGQPAPDIKHLQGLKTKDELVKALRTGFEYCDSALGGMTDEKALQPAGGKAAPINTMVGLVVNLNAHYGNLVGYMRSKGLVPPSTARAQKAKKK